MNTQEMLLSVKNRTILLKAIYSMIGVDFDLEDKLSARYKSITNDLNSILQDANTDFVRVLQNLKARNDLKAINRQIALKVFEMYEQSVEKAFVEEKRKEADKAWIDGSFHHVSSVSSLFEINTNISESEFTPQCNSKDSKRGEIILFRNNDDLIDSFQFNSAAPPPTSENAYDFFGVRQSTPRSERN